MLEGLTPDLAPRLVLAIGGVGIALVVLVLVLVFLKRRNSPLFIKGGKSREPRLMVLDAAAVDPKRRLVLIRRDDVEHLIMIGGPTDIVIESGIGDRSRPARAAEDAAPTRAVAPAPPAEFRAPAPAVERRPETVRPAPILPSEPAPAPSAERRPQVTAAAPARSMAPAATAADRPAPSLNRLVEEPRIDRNDRDRNDRGVSNVGAMLYGEDREPMTRSASPAQPVRPEADRLATAIPTRETVRPETVASVTNAAEAVLDAARSRVLNAQPAVTTARATPDADAFRRAPMAQPGAAAVTQQPVSQPTPTAEAPAEIARGRDADPSDFEKLLEAELDASGVFGQQTPQVRGETRVTSAVPTDPALVPPRRALPITGATPDVTSESEVARLLGEIAVNRKT